MIYRDLECSDFYSNYLDLLSQLTEVNKDKITYEMFSNFVKKLNNSHKIIVIIHENKIIASSTIIIENKIIHGISKVGHIEDVVIDTNVRGLGLGKKIIEYVTNLAKESGCYKVILNCKDSNVGFYEKCGYEKKENEMVKYF